MNSSKFLRPILKTSFCSFVLAAGLVTTVCAADLVRGPYLQTVTPTSIAIRWSTDVETDAIVHYGNTPDELTRIDAAESVQGGTMRPG